MATPGPSTSGVSTKRTRLMDAASASRELERLLEEESDDELLSSDSLEEEGEEDEDFPSQAMIDPQTRTDFDTVADERSESEREWSVSTPSSDSESEERPARGRGVAGGRRRRRGRVQRGERGGVRGGERGGRGRRRGGVFAGVDISSADGFQPTLPDFDGNPGLKTLPQGNRCVDYFSLFVTDELMEKIVLETNRYAEQTIQQMQARPQQMKKYSRFSAWSETNMPEIKQFLGLTLLSGIVRKPSIESYWSKHALLNTNIFPLVMPRNRYQLLLRFLHCNDNEHEPAGNDPHRDRLYKVRPVIDHLQDKFQSVYKPDKFIAVDESLLLYKGQLIFKQYIPLKIARFGIKLFHLCEDSGYTYKLHIYTGKQDPFFNIDLQLPPDAQHLSASEKIVVFMMADLLDKGYRLFMDNWYSGINLYKYLYNHGTVCCGTVRENRVPPAIRMLEVKNKGDLEARRSDQLLFIKWMSSKAVYMMSTMHDQGTTTVQRRRRNVVKPKCVVDYNSKMGAVDKADMMLQPYSATRKTFRWYKKMFVHLIQISLLNSFLVHQKQPGSKKMDFLQFQLEVIQELLYENQCLPPPGQLRTDDSVRLFERHFPARCPRNEANRLMQKQCQVCSKGGKRTDSTFYCEKCPSQPGLCVVPCFEIWHTKHRF